MLGLSTLGALGCSDYTLTGTDKADGDDTGATEGEVVTIPTDDCGTMTGAATTNSPGLGWSNLKVCNASGGLRFTTEIGNKTLVSFRVAGTEDSPTPPDYVRIVAQDYNDNNGDYPSENNFRSENSESATETAGDWALDSTYLGNLNSCYPDCYWQEVVVEMQDDARTVAIECDEYVPKVDLCLYWQYAVATRSAPIYSTCTAGSGRFRLIPRQLINHDGDSSYSVIMTPIQTSGTGALTGHAWITDIDIVEDQGQTLRIVKPTPAFRFASDDTLVDPNIVSLQLLSTNHFTTGSYSGGAPIVGVELAGSTTANFEVDMEWTCGTIGTQGERNPSLGYLVDPSDLDCTGSWPQVFTLRPTPFLSPKRLQLERYGHVEDRISIELESTANGHTFDYVRGDYRFKGTLGAYDGQGASLTVEEVSVAGIDICDAGTYSLAVEE